MALRARILNPTLFAGMWAGAIAILTDANGARLVASGDVEPVTEPFEHHYMDPEILAELDHAEKHGVDPDLYGKFGPLPEHENLSDSEVNARPLAEGETLAEGELPADSPITAAEPIAAPTPDPQPPAPPEPPAPPGTADGTAA